MKGLLIGAIVGLFVALLAITILHSVVSSSLRGTPGVVVASSTAGPVPLPMTAPTSSRFTPQEFHGPTAQPHIIGPKGNPPNY